MASQKQKKHISPGNVHLALQGSFLRETGPGMMGGILRGSWGTPMVSKGVPSKKIPIDGPNDIN